MLPTWFRLSLRRRFWLSLWLHRRFRRWLPPWALSRTCRRPSSQLRWSRNDWRRQQSLRRIKAIGHIIRRIQPRVDGLDAEQRLAEFQEADVRTLSVGN